MRFSLDRAGTITASLQRNAVRINHVLVLRMLKTAL